MDRLHFLYGFLFALSIILINPWGMHQGEIWTEPKLRIVQIIITLNFWVILHHMRKKSLATDLAWKVGMVLWALFLGVGLTSTLLSPFPRRSLWGQSIMGDGLLYWSFIGAFVLSNALVLRLKPKLVRPQLYGLLAGGAILALSMFPQVIDWRIDYTATSGKVSQFDPEMLASTVWKTKMPIGLYSNRGHTAFPLAIEEILTLLGLIWGWLYPVIAGLLYVLVCTSLFYTQCRGAILALLVALTYLFWRFRFNSKTRRLLLFYGVGLLFVSYLLFKISAIFLAAELTTRAVPKNLEEFSTGRLHLWELSLKGIVQRPLLGWGFNGFGIAYLFTADWMDRHRGYLIDKVNVSEIIRLNDLTFDYLGTDGELHTGFLMTNKAHNFFLDTTLSVGILGLIVYILLLFFFLWCALKTPFLGIEGAVITYLVYTLTWFESAQFSHLAWWILSIGLGHTRFLQYKNKHKTP